MHFDVITQEPETRYIHGDAGDLIRRLLVKDRKERLGAENGIQEIKDHPYFNDINWKDVMRRKHKYQKQYLKIDLTQTNFEYEGPDKYNIGIDVDVECMEQPADQQGAFYFSSPARNDKKQH